MNGWFNPPKNVELVKENKIMMNALSKFLINIIQYMGSAWDFKYLSHDIVEQLRLMRACANAQV